MQITYYYRAACGLCHEIEPSLEACARAAGARIERVDIDQDAAARKRYWDKIPVVAIAGGATLCAPISEADLRRAIKAAQR